MTELILGLHPQPEEPKPFIVADKNNRPVLEIMPEDFWQHTGDAVHYQPQDTNEPQGEQ